NYVTVNRKAKNSPYFSNKIQHYYCQILSLLEVLLEDCGRFDKSILSSLPLTAYSIANKRMYLRESWDRLRIDLDAKEIQQELRDLVISGIQLLIIRKDLSRSNVEYARLIIEKLTKLSP